MDAVPTLQSKPAHLPFTNGDDRSHNFHIMLHKLSPLVSLDRVREHLLLLGSFRELLEKVEPFNGQSQPTDVLRIFLSRGIHRLHLWVTKVIGSSTRSSVEAHELPPLDVLLLYHTFMLRPHRFYEASITSFPQFFAMGAFPLSMVASLIDTTTFAYTPTPEQEEHWRKCTGTPFDAERSRVENPNMQVPCPFCGETFDVPWENGGKGYGEKQFSETCLSCHATVTYDNLCVAIFLQEVRAVTESDKATISGTLLDNHGLISHPRARLIALEIVKAIQNDDGSLPGVSDLSLHAIAVKLYETKGTRLRKDRILFLMRPFTQASPFRQDLARGAFLLRQMNADLWDKGMCSSTYLASPSGNLENAFSHYKVFLELAAFPERGRVVPTADIDLIWHTHQLEGPKYREDMFSLFGMYLDHMTLEEDPRGHETAIETTSKRLKEIFATRYTTPAPLMLKSCSSCSGRGCSTCGCGPSMTQDFLVDDMIDDGSCGEF